MEAEQTIAPQEAVGIDLGLKEIAVTSEGGRLEAGRWTRAMLSSWPPHSGLKLVKTRMAKSVLDSGWGLLKNFLDYKSQQAARTFEVVSERNTSVTCSACGALSGPRGVNGLIVRSWVCSDCGESHDRDVNAARNILIGSRCRTSVRGNEQPYLRAPPSSAYRVREAGIETARAAA
jgi:transposase